MPGITGKISIDTSETTRGIKQFNQELYRPIGIIEQLEINIADLGIAIRNATDPTQLKKLNAELQSTEKTLAQYSGRGLRQLTQGQRGLSMAMTQSTNALMGFVFLMNSFDASGMTGETSKIRTSLLQGTQSTLGFTFALQALGGTVAKFALPVGILGGLFVALTSAIRSSNDEAKSLATEGIKTLADAMKEIAGGNIEALRYKYDALKGKRITRKRFKLFEGMTEEVIGISPEEEATFQFLKKLFDEYDKRQSALRSAGQIYADEITNEYLSIKKKITELTAEQDKLNTTEARQAEIANEIYVLKKRAAEITKSTEEEQDKRKEEAHKKELARIEKEKEARSQAEIDFNRAYEEEYVRTAHETEEKGLKAIEDAKKAKKKAADAAKKAHREEYEGIMELNSAAMNLADTLAGAFERAGDSGAAAFMLILRLALQIARTVQSVNFGEIGSSAGTLDILSSIFGFAKGGYTGNLPRHRVAGVVHGGEIVFEKPIVDAYKHELLALRSSLQGGARVAGYAGGGFVGQVGKGMHVYGELDLKNGEIRLREWMPGYEKYRKMKVR